MKKILYIVSCGLIISPVIVFAQVGIDASIQAEAEVEAEEDINQHNETDFDFVSGRSGTTTSSEAKGNVETDWKVEEGESAEDDGDNDGNDVSVSAREIRGWDDSQKEEFLSTVKTHAQLRSGQDLENFAQGVLLKDEDVAGVEANDKGVTVSYLMPMKFLGVFDVSLVVDAEVDTGAKVKVKFPWFSFLFSKPVSREELEEAIAAALPDAAANIATSLSARAQVITSVSSVFKTKHDTVKNSIGNIR